MITIIQSGNLGNQLFQFAFGLSVSKKINTDFVIDTSTIEQHFQLSNYNKLFIKKIRAVKYILSLKFGNYEVVDLNKDQSPEVILSQVQNNTIIHGYFQSELYFKSIENEVRSALQIKYYLRQRFLTKFGGLFKKEVVCVSIRITDYKSWQIKEIDNHSPLIPLSYYKKAISIIPDLDKKNLIFTSDDIETVKKEFIYENAFYMENVSDSLLSLLSAKELIISNSTFQWWGAWLNQTPDKKVYAPRYWLGHKVKREYPQNIIPDDWIQLDV